MIKKIIKGILMSIIIFIGGTALSLLIKLFQIFCPILFDVFAIVVILGTGFLFAHILWQ